METLTNQIAEKNKTIALAYIKAVGDKQSESFSELLHDNVEFKGTFMTSHTASDLIGAFKQLGTVLLRNEIKKIFADENEACIIYDLIFADNLDVVPCIEWIKIEHSKITSIQVVVDSNLFLKFRGELLANRSSQKVD